MKKILLLISCFLLFGCSKKENLEIVLEGNPTTGYEWTYQIEDESILVIDSTNYEEDNTEEEIVGSGGKYTYNFKAVGEGETKITFNYERSFEDVEPIYKLTYTVSVNENNKIEGVSMQGNYLTDNLPNAVIK